MSDFPAFFYHIGKFGRVESRIFQSEKDVPPGWVDTPAKLEKKAAKPAKKAKPDAK